MTNPARAGASRPLKPMVQGSLGAWITAALVVVVALFSTIQWATPDDKPVAAGTAGLGGGQVLLQDQGGGPAGGAAASAGGAGGGGGRRVVRSGGGTNGVAAGGGAVPGGGGASGAGGGAAGGSGGPGGTGVAGTDCAKGKNAGATDVGVTPNEIRFAATIVKTGIAKDFLSDAQFGMEAVRRKVNAQGGVCGRQITIDYQDDGWDPSTGQRIIEGWVKSNKYFGLAVNPSSEGLRGAIESGLVKDNQFPVVGSDGMLIGQYTDPWVWPVATSTASVMHDMVRNAIARGAQTFGIVYESSYRFGVEGRDAFVGEVQRQRGTLNSNVGIQGGQNDYGNAVNQFLAGCGGDSWSKCDFVAFLLEPATASQWKRNGGFGSPDKRPKVGLGAPQPLFLNSFARDCAASCTNLWVWTSFKPPLDPYSNEQAVRQYQQDLAAVNTNADPNNPHVEGAYVGMELLVQALQQLGPAPTRQGLKQVLDQMTFDPKLAPPLVFQPNNHFAARKAQAFEALVNNQSFAGWRYTGSDFIEDPNPPADYRP